MIRVLFYLASVFSLQMAFSQAAPPVQSNSNILNPSLNKFEGTWRWTNSNDTVLIHLRKVNVLFPFTDNSRADMLIGFHNFKRGNTVIESSYSSLGTSYSDGKFTIFGGNSFGIDTSSVVCSFFDITRNRTGRLKLTISNNRSSLVWILSNSDGINVRGGDGSFTLPLALTFTR